MVFKKKLIAFWPIQDKSITHSGDNSGTVGNADWEQIFINLAKVSPEVKVIGFVFTGKRTFSTFLH